ncbi:MAG: DUF885 domain-containing protein [Gemmatimonadetes bacterium]|nr:DUF885 domain-containing protein [Gemmatimonadota bacterium]
MSVNRALAWLPAVLAAAVVAAAPAEGQQPPGARDFHTRYLELVSAAGPTDSARLDRLFSLHWEYTNTEFPEHATYVGYPGQNGRWTDLSLAAIERRKRELRDPLLVLESIERSRLSERDRLNYDLFRRNLEEALEGARFPSEYLALTQLGGPQYLADVIQAMPAASVRDYEDMVARLERLPAVVDQTIVLVGKGVAAGVTPPRITLRDVPSQVRGLIGEDPMATPLLAPFARFPPGIPAREQARLRAAAARAYTERVRPAYQRLLEYLTTSYLPRTRESIAATSLPEGVAWYAYNVRVQTTTNRTPAEIHALGLAEVKRIRAEMDSLIRATGFQGGFVEFTQFLRTDPQFFYADSASLVRGYRDIAKRIDPELVKLFGRLPRLPYGVTTIPSYAAKSQTTAYYQPGSLEAGRAGKFFVNTYALDTRPKWEMEALSAHEAVPGHHLQIALAQELENLPEFRRFGSTTAFVEGWALYSESLGPGLGLYQDAYSKFGQLTYEMWRAIRLVLDPGIHAFGWTRQQAIDYFKANSAKTEHDITVEVDRYIVWPGQALAYKSGELKIKELRAYAELELGAAFDVRRFHDQVLGEGALPLDVLEGRIREWVAAQKGAQRPK